MQGLLRILLLPLRLVLDIAVSVPLLLYLFGGDVVCSVEPYVSAFVDSFSCRAYPGRSLGVDRSIYHITLWTSEGGQLVN